MILRQTTSGRLRASTHSKGGPKCASAALHDSSGKWIDACLLMPETGSVPSWELSLALAPDLLSHPTVRPKMKQQLLPWARRGEVSRLLWHALRSARQSYCWF